MSKPRIERCVCGVKQPHWRIVYEDGSLSSPFFIYNGDCYKRALSSVPAKDRKCLIDRKVEIMHAIMNGPTPRSCRETRLGTAYDIDVWYYAHISDKHCKGETGPVNVGLTDPVVLCSGHVVETGFMP